MLATLLDYPEISSDFVTCAELLLTLIEEFLVFINFLYTLAWHQHDVQELCRVMFDALEKVFKDTDQVSDIELAFWVGGDGVPSQSVVVMQINIPNAFQCISFRLNSLIIFTKDN